MNASSEMKLSTSNHEISFPSQLESLWTHQEKQLPGIQFKSDQTLLQLHREMLAFAVSREHHSLWFKASEY